MFKFLIICIAFVVWCLLSFFIGCFLGKMIAYGNGEEVEYYLKNKEVKEWLKKYLIIDV